MGYLLALIALGLAFILAGKASRRRHGFTDGRTLDLDRRTLYSPTYDIAARPDRIVKEDGFAVPEERKGSPRVYPSHVAQLGAQLIVMEDVYGIRPPYGYVITGDRVRHKIPNTPELREMVLRYAAEIRAMKRNPHQPIPVRQPPAKCRACGMREGCGQRQGMKSTRLHLSSACTGL